MNKDLSKTLSDIGVNAKRASAVLNTESSEQKNSFFDKKMVFLTKNYFF